MMSKSNIESIDNHIAYACECGSVRFNLLRSGKIECDKCGRRSGGWSPQLDDRHDGESKKKTT